MHLHRVKRRSARKSRGWGFIRDAQEKKTGRGRRKTRDLQLFFSLRRIEIRGFCPIQAGRIRQHEQLDVAKSNLPMQSKLIVPNITRIPLSFRSSFLYQ
jgi:hypothetical protein